MAGAEGWNPLADSSIGQDRQKRLEEAGKTPLRRSYGGPHYVVVHITGGGTFEPANNRFIDVDENVSPHYCIKKNGDIVQYVKDEHGANHAGIRQFGIDVYKDGTWRKWKRNNTGVSVTSRLSGQVAVTNEGVYSKRTDGEDWPVFAVQEECAKERIGDDISFPYIPVPTDAAGDPVTTGNQVYSINRNSIGIEIVAGGANAITDAQYASLIRLLGDLCARHKIPYDARHIVGHEDVNPIDRFGWDPGEAKGVYQLFDWRRVFAGGDWKLEDGPEPILQPPGFSVTRFPLGEGPKSPLTAFFENESNFGGYFPIGLRANVHSGIHVYPPPAPPPAPSAEDDDAAASGETVRPRTPVHAMLPGWVVAARLAPESEACTMLTGAHRGFVLLRHEFRERDAEGEPTGDAQAFYSLYLHLAPPPNNFTWQPGTDPFSQIPWLAELLETKHGSLIIANAVGQEPGAQLWLTAPVEGELKGTANVTVADPTGEQPTVDLALSGGDTGSSDLVLALKREQPADAAQAIEALRQGHVVTFNAPYLKVQAGEVLGYLEPVADFDEFPSGFLHWEVLAKADEGLKKLLELAGTYLGLDATFFAAVANDQDDNAWTKKELNEKFTPHLPQVDQDALGDQPLFPSSCYEGELLWLQHHRAPLSFADASTDHATWTGRPEAEQQAAPEGGEPAPRPTEDPAPRYPHAAGELTYPLTLRIENTGGMLDASAQQLRLRVTFEPEGLGQGVVDISALSEAGDVDTSGEIWEVKVQVPAAAKRVILHPEGDLHLDTAVAEVDLAKDLTKASFETLVPYRWRQLRVSQASPWTLQAMRKEIAARFDATVVDQLVPAYGALAWWALGTGEPEAKEEEVGEVGREESWKETAVLGDSQEEASIFGDLLPDATGKVDNVHPVTAGWAINALVEHKQIELIEDWPPVAASGEDDPLAPAHAGWVAPGGLEWKQVGDEVTALVVAKGYASSAAGQEHELTLKVEDANGKAYTLGSYPYVRGVIAPTFAAPLWGDWTLKIDGHDAIDGNQLETKLSIARPRTVGCDEPTSDAGLVRWTLRLMEPRPPVIPGWIVFRYWECGVDEHPSGDPTYAKLGIPVDLGQVPSEPPCTGDVTLDDTGRFIIGAGNNAKIPDADSCYRVGAYLSIQEGQTLRLKVTLGRLVDKIRNRVSGLHFRSLESHGLTITFKAYQPNQRKTAALKAVIEDLHGLGGFRFTQDGDWFTLTVDDISCDAAGPCVAQFRPGPVLAKLIEEHPPAEGKVLKVAYGFAAPNGGRGVAAQEEEGAELVLLGQREETGEDDREVDGAPVELDLEALRNDLGDDDLFEVWGSPNLPLAPLGFTEITHRVEREELVLTARFSDLATPADLAAAVPKFVWDGKEFGDCVAQDRELIGRIALSELYANGAEKVTIEAKLTASPTTFDGVEQEVAPKTVEVPAQPKLRDMQVVFGNGTARATCHADSWPTGKVVDLQIYREDDTVLAALKRYVDFDAPWSERRGSGFVDSFGNVGASINWGYLRTAFEEGATVKFKFLRVSTSGKVLNVAVDAVECSVTLPSEEDARKPFDEEQGQ